MTVAIIDLSLLNIEITAARSVNMSLFTNPRASLKVNAKIPKGVTAVNNGAMTAGIATTGVNSKINC